MEVSDISKKGHEGEGWLHLAWLQKSPRNRRWRKGE